MEKMGTDEYSDLLSSLQVNRCSLNNIRVHFVWGTPVRGHMFGGQLSGYSGVEAPMQGWLGGGPDGITYVGL